MFKCPRQSKPTTPWWPCNTEHWPWTRLFEFDSHHFRPNVTPQIQPEQGVSCLSQEFLWLPLYPLVLSFQIKLEHNTGEEHLQIGQHQQPLSRRLPSRAVVTLPCRAPFKHSLNLVWKHILVSLAHFDTKLERAMRAANLSTTSFHVWVIIP